MYRLRLKRPTPNASRRCPPFKSSTAYPRSCASGLFPWAAALCFAHARKNMSQHIFRPQSSFKILEKVVSERWQASRFATANLVTASGDFSAASLGKFLHPTRASTCELFDALGKASERFIDVLQYLGFCPLRT